MSTRHSRFDLTAPVVVTRISLGLLYLPHIVFKLRAMDGAASFFAKAGFEPAMLFVYLALATEIVCAVGFIFNVNAMLWSLSLAFITARASARIKLSTRAATMLSRVTGVLFVWLGVKLALSKQN